MSRPLNPWKLSGYKAGQNVICRVGYAEPGGYAVIIPKDNLPGFLPTQAQLKVGEEILAQFVCVHNNRILLSARLTGPAQKPVQSVRWEDYLQDMDREHSPQMEASQPIADEMDVANQAPNPVMEELPQTKALAPQQFEQDAAFRVWARTAPRKFQLRRAVDLILPPVHAESMNTFKISDYDLEWLITDLEGGMRTCSVKANTQDVPSRSAMLLYRGRAVGCAYTSLKW